MFCLGFNYHTHDAAAALVGPSGFLFAAEEERYSRKKHTAAFPGLAISKALACAGIGINELSAIAYPWKPLLRITGGLKFLFSYFPESLRVIKARGSGDVFEIWNLENKIRENLRLENVKLPPVYFIEHHLAHAAYAFFSSGFDSAAILTSDFCGESHSHMIARGSGNKIEPLLRIPYPHSIGFVWNAVTKYLGFRRNCDEGKVMALAAYGSGKFDREFEAMVALSPAGYKLDLSFFDYPFYDRKGQETELVTGKFIEKFGPPRKPGSELEERHFEIAHGLQALTDRIMIHLGRLALQYANSRKLCMSGGVSLNSVSNGRLAEALKPDAIYITPAANDAGTSLGAALYVRHIIWEIEERMDFRTTFLGDEPSDEEIFKLITSRDEEAPYDYFMPENMDEIVARKLADGEVVGVFRGRMEFGPRALGNRSILADPRDPGMKDHVNKKVKHREAFRPFAPAILEGERSRYFFTLYDSPYMLLVAHATALARENIPATLHVDNSARLQTVSGRDNPALFSLISEFKKITGVPVLLNTSFNDNTEPIVGSPADALRTFESTGLDSLVLGKYLLTKKKILRDVRIACQDN